MSTPRPKGRGHNKSCNAYLTDYLDKHDKRKGQNVIHISFHKTKMLLYDEGLLLYIDFQYTRR